MNTEKRWKEEKRTSEYRSEPKKKVFKKDGGNNHWKSQHRGGYQVK